MPRPRIRPLRAVVGAVAALTLTAGCAAGQVTQTNTQTSTVDGAAAQAGEIALRDISFEYPTDGSYAAGDSVRLQFFAVNTDPVADDELVSVTSPAFGEAEGLPVELPAGQRVSFRDDGTDVQLADLGESLLPSVQVDVTFTFATAGAVTVQVPVAVSLEHRDSDVEPFDFHHEEEPVTAEEG